MTHDPHTASLPRYECRPEENGASCSAILGVGVGASVRERGGVEGLRRAIMCLESLHK